MKTYENPSKSPVPSRGALHFHVIVCPCPAFSRPSPWQEPSKQNHVFPGNVRNHSSDPHSWMSIAIIALHSMRGAAKDGWSGISPLRSVSLHMILRGFSCFREVWNMWKRIGVSVVFVEFGRPTLQSPGTPSFWLEYGWTSWPGSHEPLPICRQILWPQPNSQATSS